MARFIKRYTDQQKDALLKAVLVDGLTVAEATRRAPQGRLGIEPFTVNRLYAYDIVNGGREGYEERNPEALELATTHELRRLHRLNLKRSRGLNETSDPDEVKRVAMALAATQRALGPQGKPTRARGESTTQPTEPTEKSESQSADVLSQLLSHGETPRKAKNADVSQSASQDDDAYSRGVAAMSANIDASEGAGQFVHALTDAPVASASH